MVDLDVDPDSRAQQQRILDCFVAVDFQTTAFIKSTLRQTLVKSQVESFLLVQDLVLADVLSLLL